jgi:ABC-type transporter Mla subunit MlaD
MSTFTRKPRRQLRPERERPAGQPRRRLFPGRAAGRPRSRWFTLSIGFGVLAVAALMFYIGYDAPNSVPGRSYYTIYALMHDADNLEDHFEVRIGGELAGQVLATEVVNHEAKVELQLASSFKPLRSDSTIEIRLRSAVGIRYVEIIPGTHGTPLPNDAVLPASQTSTPVNLDQVLDTFDAPTRAGTDNFVGQLGQGLAGQGENVSQTLHLAPGVLSELGSLSASVNARPQAMRNLIAGSQGAAAAVDPVRDVLANGFRPASQALRPFVVQRAGLDATLSEAPPALSTVNGDLPSVTALVAQVQGLAQAARPTLAAAPGALNQTSALLVDARPGLASANETLGLLQRAVSPTLTFLQTAQPALPQINGAISDLEPTVAYLAPRSCGLSTTMTGWSEMMKWGTPYDNFIRFTVTETGPIAGSTLGAPLTSAYPGPCTAQGDASGPLMQTPEEQVAHP